MKLPKATITTLASLLLASCFSSLSPWYEEKDIAYDAALVGKLEVTEPNADKPSAVWEFSAGDKEKRNYDLVMTETEKDEERESYFKVVLFKFGEELLLDLQPDAEHFDKFKTSPCLAASLLPGHLVCKVKLGKDEMKVQMLNLSRVEDMVEASKEELPQQQLSAESIAITATTKQLQTFMRKHNNDEEFWTETATFKRAKDEPTKPGEAK